MKVIIIDGVIGWDVYGRSVRRALEAAGGEEIEIHIASPGGFVYDGLEVFNLIRDYNRDTAKATIILKGLAASMASYIAMAVPKSQRKAEDNAIFMIHNVWSFVAGDYRDMEKEAKEIERLTNLLAKKYTESTENSLDDVRKLMDDETWYYGDEILDAGFVSEIIKTESDDEKDSLVTTAQARVKNMFAKMKEHERAKEDLERAAAMINPNKTTNANITDDLKNENTDTAAIAGKNNTEEKFAMNEEELKAKYPDLYNAVFQAGVKDGITKGAAQEFDRVKAHITLGRQAGALELAVKNIEEKKEFSLTVSAEYQAEGMKNQDITNRIEDDPVVTPTAEVDEVDEAETEAYAKKLGKKMGVK